MKVNIDRRKEMGLDSRSTGKAWEGSEQRSDTVLSDGHWKALRLAAVWNWRKGEGNGSCFL